LIAVHLESGRVEVREVPVPARPQSYALIRLILGGICNTDLELQRGYYGFSGTPGHEFVGEVVEADNRRLIGSRVVGEINIGCQKCSRCASGIPGHCANRAVLGIVRQPGAFSEYFVLPERNLHSLPDAIGSDVAVFTEPLAAAHHAVPLAPRKKGSQVAVLGDGKLGLLMAQALQAELGGLEIPVHLFGHNPEKMRIAEKQGVNIHVAPPAPGVEFDLVAEATGSADGLRTAISMTKPLGVVCMKSTVHGEVAMDSAPVIVNEISLIGSRCGEFEPALALLASGRVDVQSMISDRMPLNRAPEAFARAAQKGVLKVLLEPGTS
jgi:alcohol dehydrogenase